MTTAFLNTKTCEVENKTPDVSGLVKKTDYNAKISDIETKYFTAFDYNKFKGEMLKGETLARWKDKKRTMLINLIFLGL